MDGERRLEQRRFRCGFIIHRNEHGASIHAGLAAVVPRRDSVHGSDYR
jgi:hypothetical protein